MELSSSRKQGQARTLISHHESKWMAVETRSSGTVTMTPASPHTPPFIIRIVLRISVATQAVKYGEHGQPKF